MNKGIIAINKPQGWTSFDVVNKVKHLIKMRRVGHLGTLDPMATGVLLVTIGSATKLFDLMQEKVKTYIAEFEFGWLTDTLDATGATITRDDVAVSLEDIKRVIPQHVGEVDQIPPKYSAKSINGKRAYDLSRHNIVFELEPKRVSIYSIDILEYRNNIVKLQISCGSGTYIRSIGRDIASSIGTMATMTSLVRTKVGQFDISRAIDMQSLTDENICDLVLPINDVLDLPILDANSDITKRILNGQTLILDKTNGLYKLNDERDTIALVKINNKHAKMSVFLG